MRNFLSEGCERRQVGLDHGRLLTSIAPTLEIKNQYSRNLAQWMEEAERGDGDNNEHPPLPAFSVGSNGYSPKLGRAAAS